MIPSERIHGSDLLPLPIAAALVYDSLASHLEAARTTEEARDRLDGAAVALASLAPIYRTDGDEPLVVAEFALATGRFTDGAETLRFSDGREPISALAIRRGDLYTAIEQIKTAAMRFRTLLAIAVAAAFAATFGVLAQGTGGATSSPGTSESQGDPPAGAPTGSPTEPSIAPGGASTGSSRIAPDAFDQLDKNHDGFISREEAAGTNLVNDFDKLDTNRDGRLSPDEVTGSATGGSSRASAPRTSGDRSGGTGSAAPENPSGVPTPKD